ncbi:hypothetical protein BJ980_000401 [Nocardioides daedukensis]|uniref:Uncharacterized protein n=1 Tax=Nocardioides daedukensis TaxID=634462 RepID=A0A7Y9UMG4_9ACTN|nr:hypothetical protein [Nocardioides daedukensis]NYG57478.1 hypothetical protein [Nocardioides daedukensis]
MNEATTPLETESTQEPTMVRPASVPETGNTVVDGVLARLEGLDQMPIDEHVAVFEHAHEQLRGALDGPRLPRP